MQDKTCNLSKSVWVIKFLFRLGGSILTRRGCCAWSTTYMRTAVKMGRWKKKMSRNNLEHKIYRSFNPFTPELPMRIQFFSTTCDINSFNGQGQLCQLTSAGWREVSNHTCTRISMIQSRKLEKKAKNYAMLTQKFPRKSCSTAHIPFLSSNPKIQKVCPETFPTKVRLTKCPAQEKQKKRGWDKGKRKNRTVSLFTHWQGRQMPHSSLGGGGWMTDALALQFYQLQLIRHREVLFLPESPLGNGGGGGGKSSTGSSISGRAGPSSPVKQI